MIRTPAFVRLPLHLGSSLLIQPKRFASSFPYPHKLQLVCDTRSIPFGPDQ